MKILELRFKNLNSLYGEWVIDFTDPEYVSNGIFALTGTTGAGKSTILDAVCLALYGATPRLGKITRSSNEIMSRQTGDCYAEVLFESQAGRFRCHWEQRRARKRAEGNLQDQEHQISDETSGKPIETKKSLVTGVIEEKTGMDFDRFTRSILLAQGGFDTFLKADAEQKSRILEQITGTEVYSEISRRVHERQRDEREKLNLLQAETSGIVILDQEQEKQFQRELEKNQKQESALTEKTRTTEKALAWLVSIDELRKELDSLAEEKARLQKDTEIFRPDRDRLDRAIKAASLEGVYATLIAGRKQQADDQAHLKAEEKTLPELESKVEKHAEVLNHAEQKTLKAREELKTAVPFIQNIRSLDQKLVEQEKAVSETQASYRKDAEEIDKDEQQRQNERRKRTDTEKELEEANGYLKDHVQDEWLIGGLAGIEEQIAHLLAGQEEIVQKETTLNKAETDLKQAAEKFDQSRKQCGIRRENLAEASRILQQGKSALATLLAGRLLREYRAEKDSLLREMAFLSRISELEDYRAKLEDGTPCPLCGSKTHPFARGNLPIPDETEKRIEWLTTMINNAETQEAANIKLEEIKSAADRELTLSEKREAAFLADKRTAEKTVVTIKEELVKLRAGFSDLQQKVSGKLNPLGIEKTAGEDLFSLLTSLRDRLAAWQATVSKKTEFEKKIADIDSEIKRLEAVIVTRRTALNEKRKNLETLKKEANAGRKKRKELYGDKKPDDEEHLLNKAVADAEDAEKKAVTRNSELLQKLTSHKTNIQSLKKRIYSREPEIKQLGAEFLSALEQAGFSDEKHFLESRMTGGQRDTLSARAKELDEIQADLTARQKDREARLVAETARKITDRPRKELEPQLKEQQDTLQEVREIIAGLKHRLTENDRARERIKEKQNAVDAQKKECRRWEKLHGLIGSADGKKYRNFAQGLTFELMVSHANRQLEKMSERYLLIRDNRQPLELNVVDNYQAGEIRSTRNLSGGESFIVSLALALGLSRMASRKVRVDSLFLDEGFGTLDEEALETALETLSGLQQDGKLIGIISHVSAMRERIRTQINIESIGSGKSAISGPGCRSVLDVNY